MEKLYPYLGLTGRALIVAIFILSGFSKITGFADTQGYMEAMGVPGSLLPLVIFLEIGGGMAVLIGWQTRVAAFLLAGFSLLSALIFHNNIGDQMQLIMFMKNIAIAGGFLFLVVHGAGAFALDNRGKRSYRRVATSS